MEIKAKKKFSQNFLINDEIINKIVDISEAKNNEIIEIGPGLGALTLPLSKVAKSVIAYEVDKDLITFLEQKFANSNVRIINQDFLKSNLEGKKDQIIVGNIPYAITTEILFKILENHDFIKHSVLMVQNEVGLRITSKPNNKQYSKLSVAFQAIAKCSNEIFVPSIFFDPKPQVDSCVIKIVFNKKQLDYDFKKFLSFLKIFFQFKRKTLINNLKPNYKLSLINKVFEKFNLPKEIRSEQIEVDKIIEIFKFIENEKEAN